MISQRKINQVIWLDPITNVNLSSLYVKSGASHNMAYNTFLVKMLQVAILDDNFVKNFLDNLYTEKPELKEFSQYKIAVEKEIVVEKPLFVCPNCNEKFRDIKTYFEHLKSSTSCKSYLLEKLGEQK